MFITFLDDSPHAQANGYGGAQQDGKEAAQHSGFIWIII